MESTIESLQKEYEEMFEKIDEIEKTVQSKAGGMNIQTITETDITEFIGG